MTTRTGSTIRSLSAALLLVCGLVLACGREEAEEAPAEGAVATARVVDGELQVDLYFPGESGLLHIENRSIPLEDEATDQVALVVSALLEGPTTAGLHPPLPPGARLSSVQMSPDGTVFLDLLAPEEGPPAWGSRQEILSVYSLVDSLLLNFPSARSVVLMWNGRQGFSFAGHVDTSTPLTANTDIVARSR